MVAKQMTASIVWRLGLLSLLTLAACDTRVLPDQALPRTATAAPVNPSPPDPSLPSAATAQSLPAGKTASDDASSRVTGTLTRAQQSNAMPMPGQVNNHSSTALDPVARSASAASSR